MGVRTLLRWGVAAALLGTVATTTAAQRRAPGATMTLAERRAALHAVLQRTAHPHDAYIELNSIGSEETVPLLLERFRQDAGTAEPPAPVEMRPPSPPDDDPLRFMSALFVQRMSSVAAFSCVHHHLVEALANTTNTNRGLYYPAWEAWWRENARFSRDQWVAKGFAAAGLHVADPVDEPFALELIAQVGGPVGHLQFNALHLLSRSAAETRRGWLHAAARDDAPVRRLGVIRVLGRVDRVGHENLLRRLARDGDADVSREALTVLNDRLRVGAEAGARARRVLPPTTQARWHWGVETSVGTRWLYGDRLVAFDQTSGPRSLRRIDFAARGYRGIAVGGRIVLGSYDGDVAGLDPQGRVRWRSPGTGSDGDRIYRLVETGGLVAVARGPRVQWWDPVSGTLRRVVDLGSFVYDMDATDGVVFVGTAQGLVRIDADRRDVMAAAGAAIGVSVGPAGVCITTKDVAGCYDPDTLTARWTRAIAPDGVWGRSVAPLQAGARVVVLSQGRLSAHDARDGRVLWSTESGQYVHGALVTPVGLFVRNAAYRAELRDLVTGEVRAAWSMTPAATLGVAGTTGVIGGMDGSTWIVDLAAAAGVIR